MSEGQPSISLPLGPLHARSGVPTTEVWGLRLPEAFDPAAGAGAAESEYRAARESAALFDQSYRGVLDLEGKDLSEFLDHLVSSPAARLEVGRGQLSCLLSPKGRLAGGFILWKLAGNRCRLVLDRPLDDRFIRGLEKYAFLSDVRVLEQRGAAVLALVGPRAAEVLQAAGGAAALNVGGLGAAELLASELDGVPVRVARGACGAAAGFEIWCEAGAASGTTEDSAASSRAAERVWASLCASARALGGGPAGWRASESLRMEAGAPLGGIDYGDEHLPGEVGWESALTFDKCYVGQEVVARLRTYGHVNRKLFVLWRKDGHSFQAPGRITCAGEDAGTVCSAAYSFRERKTLGLGLVRRKFWGSEALALEDGARLVLGEPAAALGP
jgi:folate-binding protein YgfZ